jgi:hypothetical protein
MPCLVETKRSGKGLNYCLQIIDYRSNIGERVSARVFNRNDSHAIEGQWLLNVRLSSLLVALVPKVTPTFVVCNILGIPVAKRLASKDQYEIRIQTRDPNHSRSLELTQLPNTTLIAGRADNEADLRRAFKGVSAAFVNTNGFAIGEKAELYWGIRIFEIAKEEKSMRHYVWSNLDYALKLGGYDEKYKCSHYDGKGTLPVN